MQKVKLSPVAYEPEKQRMKLREPRALLRCVRLDGKFRAGVEDQQIHLFGRHDCLGKVSFHEQCPGIVLLEWAIFDSCSWIQPACRKIPEMSVPRCIGDEMDTMVISRIAHGVPTPVVEDPAFTGRHVHRLAVANELDRWQSLDWNMYARAIEPMVIDI